MGDKRTPEGWAKKRQRDLVYQKANRVRATERQKAWTAAHRDRSRWYTIKYRYGITREDYEALLTAQGGVCAICSTTEPGPWGYFVVDHSHQTDEVRGLLCSSCNTLLGGARDRVDVLREAIAYLERGGGV